MKFKVGDIVRLHGGDQAYKVSGRGIEDSQRCYCLVNKVFADGTIDKYVTFCYERDMAEFKPTCIVCRQEVQTANGLVARHEHQGKICYGSFVPSNR